MQRAGLDGDYCLLDGRGGESLAGLSRADAIARLASADFLVNIMGYLRDEEALAAPPLRVFLDVDPGFPQMWLELGLHDALSGHDRFATVGTAVGRPGCAIPTCGRTWITTLPPVAVDERPPRAAPTAHRLTGVGAWRGPNAPVVFGGERFGLRVHEFRKFADLPESAPAAFEFALDVDPADGADIARLRAGGWRLVDPGAVCADPESYRRYIESSSAEIGIAKEMYVRSASGWFSDRTAAYLAAGRPALVQATGVLDVPAGEGFLTFATLDEARAGVEELVSDYRRHARAARAIAEDILAAEHTLPRFVSALAV